MNFYNTSEMWILGLFFDMTEVWTQAFMLTKQEFY
jgi:hypothetical protein